MARRAVLEQVKSVLLVVLVCASLVLSAREPMGVAVSRAHREMPYVIEGNQRAAGLAQLLLPRRLVLHREGRHALLADPDSTGFHSLWGEMQRAALAARGTGQVEPVESSEIAALRRSRTGVEAILPAELSLDTWFAVWSGRGAPAGDGGRPEGLDRLALFVGGDGNLDIYLGNTRGWGRLRAPGGATLAAALQAAAGEAAPARELTGGWLRVHPEGVYVPSSEVSMGRLVADPEPAVDKDRLRDAFFPDSTAVRRIQSQDGATVATDGRDGLIVYPDGAVAFNRPSPWNRDRDGGKWAALKQAAEFVGGHGGWPAGARLLTAMAVRAGAGPGDAPDGNKSQSLLGYRFAFVPGYRGYPIVGGLEGMRVPSAATGVPAPLEVFTAPSGEVQGFSRTVSRPRVEQAPQRLIYPQDALSAIDGWVGSKVAVRDLFPAYLSRRSANGARVMQPVWVAELADGALLAVDGATDSATPRVYATGETAGRPGG